MWRLPFFLYDFDLALTGLRIDFRPRRREEFLLPFFFFPDLLLLFLNLLTGGIRRCFAPMVLLRASLYDFLALFELSVPRAAFADCTRAVCRAATSCFSSVFISLVNSGNPGKWGFTEELGLLAGIQERGDGAEGGMISVSGGKVGGNIEDIRPGSEAWMLQRGGRHRD